MYYNVCKRQRCSLHVFVAMSDEPPLKKARGDEPDWKGELAKVEEEYAIAALSSRAPGSCQVFFLDSGI